MDLKHVDDAGTLANNSNMSATLRKVVRGLKCPMDKFVNLSARLFKLS